MGTVVGLQGLDAEARTTPPVLDLRHDSTCLPHLTNHQRVEAEACAMDRVHGVPDLLGDMYA